MKEPDKEDDVPSLTRSIRTLDFFVTFKPEFVEHHVGQPMISRVHFKIYDVQGWGEDGVPWFEDPDNPVGPGISDVDKAEVFIEGLVKFDGCSDFHFMVANGGYYHGCERDHLTRIGEVLGRCWDIASDLTGGHD